MMRSPFAEPAVTLGLAVAATVLAVADVPALAAPRAVCVMLFMLLGPGGALLGLLMPDEIDPVLATAIAVSISVGLGTGTALLMVYLRTWSPISGLVVLSTITCVFAACDIAFDVRHRRRLKKLRDHLKCVQIGTSR